MVDKPNIYIMSDLHFDTKRLPGNVKKRLNKLAELGDLEGQKAYLSRAVIKCRFMAV